jgi:hypothetical protein
MCTKCEHILVGYTTKHTETDCPLTRARYCSSCAKRGHTQQNCPKKPSQLVQLPVYLPPQNPQEEDIHLVELKNKDCVLREYLKNHGHEGPLKKRHLRGFLQDYAEAEGLTIELIDA